jgi:hypothetical protein
VRPDAREARARAPRCLYSLRSDLSWSRCWCECECLPLPSSRPLPPSSALTLPGQESQPYTSPWEQSTRASSRAGVGSSAGVTTATANWALGARTICPAQWMCQVPHMYIILYKHWRDSGRLCVMRTCNRIRLVADESSRSSLASCIFNSQQP